MKRILVSLVLFFCFQYSFSQGSNIKIPWYPNEAVDFSLKYGIFKVGEAHLAFNNDQKCSGAFIQAYAKSSGLMKLIKNIHFNYESCMDTITGLPISDSRILIQGDYVDINSDYYDHVSREDSSLIYSMKNGTVVGPKNIYDILTGFYRYRVNYLEDNLALSYTVTTTTYFIDEVWDLTIRYCGKEIIQTIYGPVECLKVKPDTIIGHFFRSSDAMTIWLTNDGEYIPVKFLVNLKIGTLHGNMTNYKSYSTNGVID